MSANYKHISSTATLGALQNRRKWKVLFYKHQRGECHEVLELWLQSRYRPSLLPAGVVRQTTILLEEMSRQLRGQADWNVNARMASDDLLRLAHFAAGQG